MNDCAILINSCDAYSDAWGPFFRILKGTWPDCNLPIYLNTETKKCEVQEFQVTTLNSVNKDSEWGQRLIDALDRIPEKYVLFLLEDFFFEESVKTEIIEKALEWLKADESIACFNFECSGAFFDATYRKNHVVDDKYPGFGLKEKTDAYILAANPSLWRKEDLIKVTKPFESAWRWEGYGSIRAKKYPKKFYCRTLYADRPFVYDNVRGGAIHRGKWVGCCVRPLFEKYGIDVDLTERGVIEDWLKTDFEQPKSNLKLKMLHAAQRIRSVYLPW